MAASYTTVGCHTALALGTAAVRRLAISPGPVVAAWALRPLAKPVVAARLVVLAERMVLGLRARSARAGVARAVAARARR